jgi:NAD-dependent deacetylase
LESLLALLRRAERVSLLSGAGTSTESGIPDIRGRSPFWRDFPAQVFHLPSLLSDETTRERFREMDRRFQALVLAATPSGMHRAVRRLAELGRLSCVATQNVDGLFQRAGVPPKLVRELHGTVFSLRCLSCRLVHPRPLNLELSACPACGGFCMADMVLMGEAVDRCILDEVLFRVCSSDLLIVAGTSLSVDPAASLCSLAAQRGVPVAILNLEPTPQDYLANLVIRRPAGALLLHAVERLEAELAGHARITNPQLKSGRGGAYVP